MVAHNDKPVLHVDTVEDWEQWLDADPSPDGVRLRLRKTSTRKPGITYAEALDVARSNLAGLGRAASNVTITRGDWFDALHPGLIADVIVTNPPYVAAGSPDLDDVVARWEPASALMAGPDGLDAIRRIVSGARGHLTEGGWLLIEHGHDQGAAVRGLFEDAGFESVETHRDLAGRERVTSGRT